MEIFTRATFKSILSILLMTFSFSTASATDKGKILVVGGAGYIGSTAASALIDQGYNVHILDDLTTGHKELAKQLGLEGKLTVARAGNQKEVSDLLNREKFDAVMYFAAKSQVAESVQHPEMYFENNVEQTKLFLEMMLRSGTKTFIFSSTAATYGNPLTELISETHPQKPINPYGQTKLEVEKHLAELAQERGLRAVALRYFNAAGAEPKLRVGEKHDPETHLIPNIFKAIITGKPMQVFGTDYPTKDGTAIRDYIAVDKLVDAHILAMNWLWNQEKASSGGVFEAFNLGSKYGFTVREVIEAVEKVTGKKVPLVESPRRPGDPARLVADSTKAKNVLGFEATPPGTEKAYLENIIRTAWQWESRVQKIFKRTCSGVHSR